MLTFFVGSFDTDCLLCCYFFHFSCYSAWFIFHLESPDTFLVEDLIHFLKGLSTGLLEEEEDVDESNNTEGAKDTICLEGYVSCFWLLGGFPGI